MSSHIRLAVVSALCATAFSCSDFRGVTVLTAGRSARFTVSHSATADLRVIVPARQWFQVAIDQGEHDLRIELADPQGSAVRTVDAAEFGIETVTHRGEGGGIYRLSVSIGGDADADVTASARLTLEPPGAELWKEAEDSATLVKRMWLEQGPKALPEVVALARQVTEAYERIGNCAGEMVQRLRESEILYAAGDFSGAFECARTAARQAEELGSVRGRAEGLTNAGVSAWRLERIDEAEAMLQTAYPLWRSIGNRLGQAAALNNLSLLYARTGEWHAALASYRDALELVKHAPNAGKGMVLSNLGLLYQHLGDYESAADYLQRAVDLFSELKIRPATARAFINLGRTEMFQDREEAAGNYFRTAIDLLGADADPEGLADARVNLGQLYVRRGENENAEAMLSAALQVYTARGNLRGEASVRHHLGLLRMAEDPAGAIVELGRSVALRRDLGLLDDEASSLTAIAAAERRLGRFGAARKHLQQAVQLLDGLRGRVYGEHFRASYFSARRAAFDESIDLLMDLHQRNPAAGYDREAFRIAEQSRARTLLDSLAERAAGTREADAELIRKQHSRRRQINLLSAKLAALSTEPQSAAREQIQTQIDHLLDDYREMEAEIRHRQSAQGGFAEPGETGAGEVQGALEENTVLVEYYLGDRASFAWVLTPGSLRAVRLPARRQMEQVAEEVLQLLPAYRRRLREPEAREELDGKMLELGRMVWGPIEEIRRAGRVIIAADGVLHRVPFAALPSPHHRNRALGLEQELMQIPSASALPLLRSRVRARGKPKVQLAIFADPVYHARDSRMRRYSGKYALHEERGLPLARLQEGLQEVHALAPLVEPGESLTFTGFRASKAALTEVASGNIRFLHLSAHARVDEYNPETSWIALSQFDEKGERQEGLLSLHDIYRLDLPVELVFAAACETAAGPAPGREGPMSLARGFLHAGASRVVATLWQVQEESAVEYVRFFYGSLLGSETVTVPRALLLARQRMARSGRWQDPYHWAPYVMYGM